MALLEVEDLTIEYRTRQGMLRAVEGVSFALEEGESLGLVGESGCGKTTIGMALMGLLPPNGRICSGQILFEGQDLLALTPEAMRRIRWARMSMIFQAAMNALNPVQRVDKQILEAIITHEPTLGKVEARKRVRELFRLVGLPAERLRDYPHQYSGGMKQRVVIAMALACRPRLIIADEPTTALDVIVQHQILEEIKRLQKELDLSLIFISHDISIVAEVSDRIGIMYAGQLVEYGTRERVFGAPVHPYTRALLASFPTLAGRRERLQSIPGEAPNLLQPFEGCRFCDRCVEGIELCRQAAPPWVRISEGHQARCCRCVEKGDG